MNDEGIGTTVLQNSKFFESENVEVPEFNMGDYENMTATELNMGDYDYVAATELNMGDYKNVAATKLNIGDYENLAAVEFNLGASEHVKSGYVHMDVHEEFATFTYDGDDEIDVDESESKDPNFRRADWESSVQLESFGSFVDEEIDNEVNHVEQYNKEVEEVAEQARVKSDNEGETVNSRARRVNPPPAKPIYDGRGRSQVDLYQLYDSHKHFQHVLIEYAILHGFEFMKIKASSTRQTYMCKAEGCLFG